MTKVLKEKNLGKEWATKDSAEPQRIVLNQNGRVMSARGAECWEEDGGVDPERTTTMQRNGISQ